MPFAVQPSSQFQTQFPPGTLNIKFSQLRDVFRGPQGVAEPTGIVTTSGSIRAGELLRNTNVNNSDPVVPDATENANISTGSDWKVSQFRGSIKFYVVDHTGSDNNVALDNSVLWNNNLQKSIRKFVTIRGTIGGVNQAITDPTPAARWTSSTYNTKIICYSSSSIYGVGGLNGMRLVWIDPFSAQNRQVVGDGAGTGQTRGAAGGDALRVNVPAGNLAIDLKNGSRLYGGGGGGAGGNVGGVGPIGYCPRTVYLNTGTNCGSCPGCPSGYTPYGCPSAGGCNCGKGGCRNTRYYRQCYTVVYDAKPGATGGNGGSARIGRGFNNFGGSLTGSNGDGGYPAGCDTFGPRTGSDGYPGEKGGDGGDWGQPGQGTSVGAQSPAGRSIVYNRANVVLTGNTSNVIGAITVT